MFYVLTNAIAVDKTISHSFGGSNNYFLHGMLADHQVQYIESLAADGAKVVRLWGT